MGEVYRARDTRLPREVAIKVLPPSVADNPTRRARFEREAQAIAQLSHPHICALYDVGEQDGNVFLVMEFIEGESLDDRLRRGPVPWRVAVSWAIQIASAVDAAHRHNIVHRDLKPSNVMVNESGVKLLDFGLAKLAEDPDADRTSSSAAGDLPSTASLTGEQRIVGTVRYMAPEQLEGRPVDGRTDIFAFGATLYEVLTGRRAFDGTSSASVTAQILTVDPPPLSAFAIGKSVPTALNHVVRRALAKDPADRWQTARDVAIELRWVQDGLSGEATSAMARPSRLPWVAAVCLVLAGAAAFLAGPVRAWLQRDPVHAEAADVFEITAPEGTAFTPGYGLLATSPDGRKIAFLAGLIDTRDYRIYVRDLAVPEARLILNTDGAHDIFWSPDSKSLGYFTDQQQLMRVDLYDQMPTELATYPVTSRFPTGGNPFGVWPTADTIFFTHQDQLFRLPAAGGPVTPVGEGQIGTLPTLLSGHRVLTVVPHASKDQDAAMVRSLDRPRETWPMLPVHSNAVAAEGYLVYRQEDALVAQPFDEGSLTLSGHPITLVHGVQYNPGNTRTVFDVSGELLVYRRPRAPKLTWRSRNGQALGSLGEADEFWNPALAPDGSGRVAVDRFDPVSNRFSIATVEPTGRVTAVSHNLRDRFPVWSPDGRWIVSLGDPPEARLVRMRSDGTGAQEILISSKDPKDLIFPLDWSADGRYLLYETGTPGDLWALPVAPSGAPMRITDGSGGARCARFSPDGHWIAYAVMIGGVSTVWVQAFPDGGQKRRVSPGQGYDPSWRADGRELYYMTENGALMAATVAVGATFASQPPVMLFQTNPGSILLYQHVYAAAPDGQRFLVTQLADTPDRITVVRNWTSLVR
jgi:Tol biopolymer transport system component/predicted Ser/Thr protein kinase